MARQWTPEQRLAIDTRNKSLLVSAAAGSGKTATLTERIIESILDDENPADISKMLIVTFTRAAVGELRERIGAAIKEKLSENPENRRLEEQLMLLPSAKILTIDAFCNDCLKSFPEAAGISFGYRIADEAEILLISREIFDGLCESVLRGELEETVSAEDFEKLTDCLADSRKMADVFDVFKRIYDKLRNTADGVSGFERAVSEYSPENFTSPDKNSFGKFIFEREKEEFAYRATLFEELSKKLSAEPENVIGNYAAVAQNDAEVYTRVKNSANFAELRERVLSIEYEKLSSPRGAEKTALMQSFSALRDKEKKLIAEEKSRFFIFSDDDWRAAAEALLPLMQTFYKVLSLFDSALDAKKRTLSTFDYTDIERLCYSALIKNGEPTDAAISLREQFSYVYIDEYQDVNDLQDAIFRAVSREDNRFAVGDIKQSIYGFRSADPTIFRDAKRSYPLIEDAENSPAASLFMSKNFRSSGGVIDFVNSVFDTVFEAFSEGIDYSPADRLTAGREPLGEGFFEKPVIVVCPKNDSSDEEDTGEDSEDDDCDDSALAPRAVAAKIREILDTGVTEDGKKPKPSDIAIILRSLKNKSEAYVEALEEEGIPVKTSGKKNFFINPDVLLALCLLNTINNPLRDVYLTGLLRSPLFGFSAAELVSIRGRDKYRPFYYSLTDYAEAHPEFSKGKDFLKTLAAWRECAEGIRTDKLLARLFRETGLLALASECGEKDNLVRLYEYARTFEGSAFGGLGSFISYINNVIAENGKFDCNISAPDEDAVTVISAHSSKGLEYPIVFFADAGRKISCRDTAERFLYLRGIGAAMRARTPQGLAIVNNPMINAVAEKMKEENLEEELRILYVALTRARERLFVVGSVKGEGLDEYEEKISALRGFLKSRAAVRRLSSHLDIVAAASGLAPILPSELTELKIPDENPEQKRKKPDTGAVLPVNSQENTAPEDAPQGELTEELYLERFEYKYHSLPLTLLPEKMSVSALYPTVLDGTEEGVGEIEALRGESEHKRSTPEFICPGKAEESKKRGIATHLFLQFCDLENLKSEGAQSELKRLTELGFISEEDAPRVRISEIEAFLRSELFKRMTGAVRIWREFRFNTPLPASLFSEEKERLDALQEKKILVQGVMDCVIEEADGSLVLVDYKTDRLTKKELEDEALAEERLRSSHENQLHYYCLAAEKIFGKPPKSAEVYSLHLGRCVDVMKK